MTGLDYARSRKRTRFRAARWGLLWAVACALLAGCSTKAITLRSYPQNPLAQTLNLFDNSGPHPSERTQQLLRFYNLGDDFKGDPRGMIAKLQQITDREPSAEKVYALAELTYIEGRRCENRDKRQALDLYGAAVLHAHRFLFDEKLAPTRNQYDPQFRWACDLYNASLESALRIVCARKELVPGANKTINTAAGAWDIECVVRGATWRNEDFDHFEFASDYEIKGLRNHFLTHGLGVPLIAVRRGYEGEPAAARYYPPELSFPVTAFLRPVSAAGQGGQYRGVLELHDPVTTQSVQVGGQCVALESDLSTPLAYFLARPELDSLATAGLLRPETLLKMRPGQKEPVMGLYMCQPYEPNKIPVVLVHGLWSSPMTWMEVFNDLRSCPEIRDNYQIWFYLYPTGQPFWLSASMFRRDLVEARHTLDPGRQAPALDQMVLVGHSMGGLISKLQTLDSGDQFWQLASSESLDQIKADPEVKQKLREVFYFQPNPSIRRVVTLGTPQRGSSFSNDTTQWLLGKLIQLPQKLVGGQQKLFRDNPTAFPANSLVKVETSIDSLSPACPVFPVMLASSHLPEVKYHNVIGVLPKQWWVASLTGPGDGVVAEESARVDGVASELIVPADHTTVHTHPAAVLEIRRILLEHLSELRGSEVRFARGAGGPLR